MLLSSCLSAAGSPDPVPAGDFALLVEGDVDSGDLGFATNDPDPPHILLRAPDFHLGAFDHGQQNVLYRAPDFHQGARGAGAP